MPAFRPASPVPLASSVSPPRSADGIPPAPLLPALAWAAGRWTARIRESPNDCDVEPGMLDLDLTLLPPADGLLCGVMRIGGGMLVVSVHEAEPGAVTWRSRELDAALRPHPRSPDWHHRLVRADGERAEFEREPAQGEDAGPVPDRIVLARDDGADGAALLLRYDLRTPDGGWRTLREMRLRRTAADGADRVASDEEDRG